MHNISDHYKWKCIGVTMYIDDKTWEHTYINAANTLWMETYNRLVFT